jgi:hypothetical protein
MSAKEQSLHKVFLRPFTKCQRLGRLDPFLDFRTRRTFSALDCSVGLVAQKPGLWETDLTVSDEAVWGGNVSTVTDTDISTRHCPDHSGLDRTIIPCF